jgi:hypothetical protein
MDENLKILFFMGQGGAWHSGFLILISGIEVAD